MPGEEQHEKELYDLLVTGGWGAVLAIIFQAAGLSYRKEKFSWASCVVSLVNAGCVGALTAWMTEEFSVPYRLRAVIIAICGRVGAPLLDIIYVEVQETVKAAFDGLQHWLEEGRWDRHDH
ncbi:MAG: phage holin family protein [Pyramidobacter sp.]|jgi:hypothetical protein